MIQEHLCAIYEDASAVYPTESPFHPARTFPEYMFGADCIASAGNTVYEMVRKMFRLLRLDEEHFDKASWNPLGKIIKPGDRVTIKPNFVLHFNASGHDVQSVVTHGSVIRAVLDYVLKALNGTGSVIVGDAPHGNADFEQIVQFTGTRDVISFFEQKGFNVVLTDFRQYRYGYGEEGFLKETKTPLAGDPLGYTRVDLKEESELNDLTASERLYGADYDRSIIREHHNSSVQEYLIANSVLLSDVVIGIPKLKVHSKAGVTINLKNLVGINGDKNWLPHYRIGNPSENGDEFPVSPLSLENRLRRLDRSIVDSVLSKDTIARKLSYRAFLKFLYPTMNYLTRKSNNRIFRGNWAGNDTVWRMVLDLNKILLYADKQGKLQETKQRKFFSIVDGIIAGEGEGPLSPTPKHCGILLGGFSPLLVDLVGAKLMGIDPARVPLFRNASRDKRHPLAASDLERSIIVSNNKDYEVLNRKREPNLGFLLPFGWWNYASDVKTPQEVSRTSQKVDEACMGGP